MTTTVLHSHSLVSDSLGIGSLDWEWLSRNSDTVRADLVEHVQITFAALALSLLVAIPVGLAAYRWGRTYPLVLGLAQVLYTIPSLALFVLLINLVGLGQLPVILGLTVYALVILVRNLVEALRAVPSEVIGAASAMGYRQTARLFAVELPLAVPAIIAGLRVAAVSTISLVSVGAVIGTGGLGQLFIHGFQIDNPIEIWAGIVATVLLALTVDLLLVAFGRACTPWARAVR
jgi:osmoprotectant transport system permease protein